ncbi:hypothetical protein HMPREF9103_00926 [Lentilactobacillus parafarraginis F0439]|uniref:Uncharacterized protein n=1 Tax=Lentilactobacillus parafarraginis F0439 TaxID=797515 RepID=G9ZMH7_9LACO|nr:hypothetical protein HMPREF9103_00926 [Lentilactobacillus parafarraginis F0439]
MKIAGAEVIAFKFDKLKLVYFKILLAIRGEFRYCQNNDKLE